MLSAISNENSLVGAHQSLDYLTRTHLLRLRTVCSRKSLCEQPNPIGLGFNSQLKSQKESIKPKQTKVIKDKKGLVLGVYSN